MSKIKTRPLSRCTNLKYDCPVKTNHMIGILNTILLQLDLKVMNSDLLNMRQITLSIRREACLPKIIVESKQWK